MCKTISLNNYAICIPTMPEEFLVMSNSLPKTELMRKNLLDAIINPKGLSAQSYRAGYLAMAPGKIKKKKYFSMRN